MSTLRVPAPELEPSPRPVEATAVEPSPSPAGGSGLRIFGAVTVGHFAIDVFNSQGPVLLAFLKSPLGLSAAQVGFAVGLHQFLAGATQPIFGWIADRFGSRWLGPTSVLCTLVSVSLAVAAATRGGSFSAFLVFFALAAIGSGAFHPQGTMHAGTAVAGRAATTTALFFFFGQTGLASGPALAGFALDRLGPRGIYLLAAALCPVPLFMAIAMRGEHVERAGRDRPRQPILQGRLDLPVLALFATVFGLRAWIFIGTAAFLPLLFRGYGWSSTQQGLVTGLFWLGGGVAGVVAGGVADRWGRRRILFVTTLLGALLLYLLPTTQGGVAFLLSAMCGALLGAPHSILMVMSQVILPVRRGLASGLALGYLFTMGAVGSWAIGLLADRFGLTPVLQAGAAIGVLAALLCLALPTTRAGTAST